LNGAAIPAGYGTFSPIAGSDYSFARLKVPAGSYSLSSSTGLGVYGSGFDDDISYAYPAGFGLVNLIEFPGGADSLPSDENDSGSAGNASTTPASTTPASTTPAAALAATGANVEWLMVAGLLVAISGSGFLAFSRRKRIW
jgi:LPXTG-motif cell wall-anchored protein